MADVDILVLGATGFTGKLVTKYLASHPEKSSFKLGISVRTKAKGAALLAQLALAPDSVTIIELDVTDSTLLNASIARTKVIINTVGPFWKYSTPVITACARLGKHYVDLTGETFWIYSVLRQVDTLASHTGAIIIPSCGLDSLPADLSAFLSVRTLQNYCDARQITWSGAGRSLTGYDMPLSPSGGTLETMAVALSSVPRDVLSDSMQPYALSPVKGTDSPVHRALYRMRDASFSWGSFFIMSPANRAIVHRSWGMFELQAQLFRGPSASYGAKFQYDEFLAASNPLSALLSSITIAIAGLFILLPPVRWMIKKAIPPGSGPSEKAMNKGHIKATNVTELSDDTSIRARTDFVGKGDPGYLLTSVMISEAALGLLFTAPEKLGPLAATGGLLTPATALGSVLPDRLRRTGLFEISSHIVDDEPKKDR
ncbi:saccharopine dehydrogenase [Exidia glandulosa HHB12029]|uniref:Saccharopine dehydrogenase n=1 Tax=Exidia glandulosa HHB12029 TaxID=1314781 RepID=A0A165KR76_EXIGL|nr:saccharopine dehydrogenase [Exidia glandulosa HHB12029]